MNKSNFIQIIYPGGITFARRTSGFNDVSQAFVSCDRTITWERGNDLTQEKKEYIEAFAATGNRIGFAATDKETLVLKPIQPYSLEVYNPYMDEWYFLTVEHVNGQDYVCVGSHVWLDAVPSDYDAITKDHLRCANMYGCIVKSNLVNKYNA